MEIEPLHEDFGVRVRGFDLTVPLDSEEIALLHHLVDDYSVVLFPAQRMTDEAQMLLTSSLGEPEENHVIYGRTGELVYIGTVGNAVSYTHLTLPTILLV